MAPRAGRPTRLLRDSFRFFQLPQVSRIQIQSDLIILWAEARNYRLIEFIDSLSSECCFFFLINSLIGGR